MYMCVCVARAMISSPQWVYASLLDLGKQTKGKASRGRRATAAVVVVMAVMVAMENARENERFDVTLLSPFSVVVAAVAPVLCIYKQQREPAIGLSIGENNTEEIEMKRKLLVSTRALAM